MHWRVFGILLLLEFYAVYFGKLLAQRQRGIRTNQIAHGKTKSEPRFWTEVVLKVTAYGIVPAELTAIMCNSANLPEWLPAVGGLLAALGDIAFTAAVFAMKDNWRAGIAEKDQTELVTSGIYAFSRNPAFLGFDLLYLGILLMFFHWSLLIFTAFAILALHFQILQEEQYLCFAFGQTYAAYQRHVCRYFGKKR